MTGFELAQEQDTQLGKIIVLAMDACKHGIPNFDNLPESEKMELVEKAVRLILK